MCDWLHHLPNLEKGALPGQEIFHYMCFYEDGLRNDELPPAWTFCVDMNVPFEHLKIALCEISWSDAEGNRRDPIRPHEMTQDRIDNADRKIRGSLLRVTAISHPVFYVVEDQPILTPREERRSKKRGGAIPDRKRKRYVVVDHQGLETLRRPRRGDDGGLTSPTTPHERRGHWRRLAESCTKARAEGKTRTWIRPAIVGSTEWSDQRNKYRVILNPADR